MRSTATSPGIAPSLSHHSTDRRTRNLSVPILFHDPHNFLSVSVLGLSPSPLSVWEKSEEIHKYKNLPHGDRFVPPPVEFSLHSGCPWTTGLQFKCFYFSSDHSQPLPHSLITGHILYTRSFLLGQIFLLSTPVLMYSNIMIAHF